MRTKVPMIKFGIMSLLMFFLQSLVEKPINDEKKNYVSLEKLIKNQQIEAEINGTGGHLENCIEFKLKNLTPDSLNVWIEAGRRLTSVDTNIQDILIVQNKTFQVGPDEDFTAKGNGYCCQSNHQSPRVSSEFRIGKMAPENWLKLAKIIDKNKFPPLAIQSAVWVVSNNHELSSIHCNNMTLIAPLRHTVAEIKGLVLPWYTLTYENDTSTLFSGKPSELFSEISYYLNTNAAITITIRNTKGELVYTVANRLNPGRGHHSFELKLPVRNWPKGDYSLCIYEDYNNLNTKKVFRL